MISPRHTRKADFNERFYICQCTEAYATNFSNTVKYNQYISKNLLSNALRSFILKNSWLLHNFFRIDDQDSAKTNGHNWVVKIIDNVQFDDVVKYEKIDEFNESIMERVDSYILTMNENLPLWRIIMFEENNGDQVVCVYVDHSHFDGLSGVQFQKDLSKELSTASDDKFISELFSYEKDGESLPDIEPSVESITDLYYPSYLQIMKNYLSSIPLMSGLFASSVNPPVFQTTKPIDHNLSSKYKFLRYTPQQVEEITKFCRANGITLTSYFDVLFLQALEETVFKEIGNGPYSTSSLVAINGRRYYSDDIKNFKYGSMVCGDEIILKPILNTLESMKLFHKTLIQNIKSRYSFKLIGLLQYVNIWDWFKFKIGKVDRFTMTISNLGKIADSNSTFTFKEMYFCSNTSVVFNTILNMTTLPNNELTAVIGYVPELSKYNMEDFVDRFYFSSSLPSLIPS
ncbi:unnamed protein product [Candida verbasci]|uniref:Uncharacterized protein n=1 Tax=Candida verbasci TaxID=1227364 RepID=A0A9W4TZC5_9ASCO|nr:unnamed protein product [Candida verbasci]